jgi:hypothetical protein
MVEVGLRDRAFVERTLEIRELPPLRDRGDVLLHVRTPAPTGANAHRERDGAENSLESIHRDDLNCRA